MNRGISEKIYFIRDFPDYSFIPLLSNFIECLVVGVSAKYREQKRGKDFNCGCFSTWKKKSVLEQVKLK